jgi:hypothetical protein
MGFNPNCDNKRDLSSSSHKYLTRINNERDYSNRSSIAPLLKFSLLPFAACDPLLALNPSGTMLRPVVWTCLRPRAAPAFASPGTAPTPAATSAQCIAHPRLLSTSLLRPKFMLLYSPASSYRHAGCQSPDIASIPSARRHFAASSSTNAPSLSWDEFLRLRRQRRLAGLIASFPTAILGLYGGGLYFATQELDPTQTILGMDPYIMSVVFTAGCGLFGWLMGPTVGRGVWHLVHRKQAQLVTEVLIPLYSFFPVQPRPKLTILARGPIFHAYSEKQSGPFFSILQQPCS